MRLLSLLNNTLLICNVTAASLFVNKQFSLKVSRHDACGLSYLYVVLRHQSNVSFGVLCFNPATSNILKVLKENNNTLLYRTRKAELSIIIFTQYFSTVASKTHLDVNNKEVKNKIARILLCAFISMLFLH